MKPNVSIPRELLAQVDLANTINGGVAQTSTRFWQDDHGYHLILRVPGIAPERIRIEAVQQRFVVYYMLEVFDGALELPHYLINVPLLPVVDVNRIEARIEDGQIYIFAPFNDWAKGVRREIALGE